MIRCLMFLALAALAPASAQADNVLDDDFFRCGYFSGALAAEAFPGIQPSDDEVNELHHRASLFDKAVREIWIDARPQALVAKMMEAQWQIDEAYDAMTPEEFRNVFAQTCSAAELRAVAVLNEAGVDLYDPEDRD